MVMCVKFEAKSRGGGGGGGGNCQIKHEEVERQGSCRTGSENTRCRHDIQPNVNTPALLQLP